MLFVTAKSRSRNGHESCGDRVLKTLFGALLGGASIRMHGFMPPESDISQKLILKLSFQSSSFLFIMQVPEMLLQPTGHFWKSVSTTTRTTPTIFRPAFRR